MAKILDATPEEQKALAQAMEQLQKDAAKLTNAQRKLLSEWGKMSKVTDELKKELDLLKTYEALFAERNAAQKDFNQLLKLQNDIHFEKHNCYIPCSTAHERHKARQFN